MGRKVFVLGEIRDGVLRNVSFEAIAAAKVIADGGEVVAALFGESIGDEIITMLHYGADRVVKVEHPDLKSYTTDAYQQALLQVLEAEKPDGIVMGHTAQGKDLSPRIAAKINTGLVSDVVNIENDDGNVIFTSPIYSGKAFEKVKINEGIIFATIRPNNITPLERDQSRSGDVSEMSVDIKNLRAIIKDIVRKSTGGIDLSEAKIIVSGGRGVKAAENFQLLEELAGVLGAAVGASRGACDAGYCDYSLQIGQTGKVVTPDLYIAVGISGAIQHLAGMSNSKVIVAINKDPEAPIFDVADYGIVGDLFEVVPLFIEEMKSVAVS
ncbi:electron transfer flavoprotein subunit alpha/FixB family protein [Niallia endozanthoxylica]|uniref:Electron transfer flavoprotein subunit alpha/FixB family protein n=1 Tax=Niallia endozanthoxylica TaxID=2036016 RepID=A0A5J5HNI0_9BACI|nr:electron transfer flavoprotein subunit alpha/FixB family protein [Niallia endozanthoxylica]KAA9022558.1 electron transfer flavoprotein subunit alpha/FixB family protein [Niallia endozanthoxylica]